MKGSDTMFMKLFASIEPPIDSKALYDELEDYSINVTDFISNVAVYGNVEIFDIQAVVSILVKYGCTSISLKK